MSVTITAASSTSVGYVTPNAVLAIGDATSGTPSTTYQAVGAIVDITNSGVKLGSVTSNTLASRNVRRIGTTLDFGTVTVTVNNDSSDTGQSAVSAAQLAAVPYDFVVQYKDSAAGKTITAAFSALVTEFGAFDLADDKLNTSKIELSIDGGWTITSA